MPTVSSVASPEPQIVTLNDYSNEPTMPCGFEGQLPTKSQILNHLNLPPNPFNILATMAPINTTRDGHEDNYSQQLREPSVPSPTSTPPMNVSTFNIWETPHTTTDDNTFYSKDGQSAYTGSLPRTKHSILKVNPDEFMCCPLHHRRHLPAR